MNRDPRGARRGYGAIARKGGGVCVVLPPLAHALGCLGFLEPGVSEVRLLAAPLINPALIFDDYRSCVDILEKLR